MSNKSEFLGRFRKAADKFNLYGSKILVERIELGEVKTAGGIILAHAGAKEQQFKMQQPLIAVVLATGKGYFDADSKSYEPLEVKPGNVVMLNSMGVQFFSTMPGSINYNNQKIGLTTESDIQMIFESLEQFEEYAKVINEQA